MNVFCVSETADDTDDSSMSLGMSQNNSFFFYNSLIVVSVFVLILYSVILTIVLVMRCYK